MRVLTKVGWMSLISQTGWLARKEEVTAVLAADRAKLKW